MTNMLHHRGPDGSGSYIAQGVGLGHRRLSIIDIDGGNQPVFNENGSIVAVYNGEIYNFKELMGELRATGHQFKTRCDTEVIVHAYEEWGSACVERFRGMFAFAVYDHRRHELFIARDRLGIKPLYYGVSGDGLLVFASELKAILALPEIERSLDTHALEEYLGFGYIPDPKTIYRNLHKLPPGHTLTNRRGGLPEIKQYWDIVFEPKLDLSEPELCGELIDRLRDAVNVRRIADVPLGAFLSGGVDSSSVVAVLAGLSPDPVRTCSIGFGDSAFDETRYAEQISTQYRTTHNSRYVEPDSFDLVDKLAAIYDEPFADSSAIPTYQVCKLARETVTVALSGDGGDELFAGYRRYRWHNYEEQVRRLVLSRVRAPLFATLGAIYPKLDWAPKPLRAKSTLQAIARDTADAFFQSVSIVDDATRAALLSQDVKFELGGYGAVEIVRETMRRAPTNNHIDRAIYCDLKTYLPGDILTKIDRASMAHSLEVRVPILDHYFVEWAARIRTTAKLNKREGKYILKKALEPFLRKEVLYRPKMGFAVPLAKWFRGPLRDRVRDSLLGSSFRESGLFDTAYIARVLDQHESGRRDHSATIWGLSMFESFQRNDRLTPPKHELRSTLAMASGGTGFRIPEPTVLKR